MGNPNKKPPVLIIRKLYEFIQFLFSKLNKLVDMIIFSKTGSVMVSLIVAVIIAIGANYEQIGLQFNASSRTTEIQDVQVETLYDSSKYVISGIPSTVSVQLNGNATDIELFRRQGDITVEADLQKSSVGQNIVDLKVKNLPSNLKAEISPSSVTATISKKTTKKFTVSSELLLSSDRKESDYDSPILSVSEVRATGTEEQIDSIVRVKAIIDGTNQSGSFESDATLVAYDAQGNTVDVDLSPTGTHASVTLKNNDSEE